MIEINDIQKEESLISITYETIKIIKEQMGNNICVIENNKTKGIGFFCKIPFYNNQKDDNYYPVLITSNHVINSNIPNKGDQIIFLTTKDKPEGKTLNLKGRKIYQKNEYDISIIYLNQEDGFNHYLELEESLINSEKNNKISNKSIYMFHHDNEELYVSYGHFSKYKDKNNISFYHSCNTAKGSSGSPILNLENNKIIGISQKTKDNNNICILSNLFDPTPISKTPNNPTPISNTPNNQTPISKTPDNPTPISKTPNNPTPISNTPNNLTPISNTPKNPTPISKTSNPKTEILGTNTSREDLSFNFINDLDVLDKRGFIDFGSGESSRLNAIIQMLTSIKEIQDFMNSSQNGEKAESVIKKFNHIYVLTSFYFKAFKEVFKTTEKENPSLKQMDIIIKYLNQDISNKSSDEYLLFILNRLHEELISYPNNNPDQVSSLISSSDFNEYNTSLKQFYINKNYCPSIISNLFSWIRCTKRACGNCQNCSFCFQSLPLLLLDLDQLNSLNNNNLSKNCFDLQSYLELSPTIQYYNKNNKMNDICPYCKSNCDYYTYHSFQTSPLYLLIKINRNNPISLTYKEDLALPVYQNSNFSKSNYKLIGVIMKENPDYTFVIKNSEDSTKGKINENWIKFMNEKIKNIWFEKNDKIYEEQKEIFHPFNADILIYKSINRSENFEMYLNLKRL